MSRLVLFGCRPGISTDTCFCQTTWTPTLCSSHLIVKLDRGNIIEGSQLEVVHAFEFSLINANFHHQHYPYRRPTMDTDNVHSHQSQTPSADHDNHSSHAPDASSRPDVLHFRGQPDGECVPDSRLVGTCDSLQHQHLATLSSFDHTCLL